MSAMNDALKAAWAITAATALGGAWLLFVAGPTVEAVLVAVVAGCATFLALELAATIRQRRGP